MSAAIVSVDDLSRNELLDRADVLHTTVRRAEADVLVLAVRFALLHGVVQDPSGDAPRLPGREGLKQLGGAGTPTVAEFAPAMLGARLGLSPYAGASLIADALDLYYRHPCLWARVAALEVKACYAREVARRTRDLPKAHAAQVDHYGPMTVFHHRLKTQRRLAGRPALPRHLPLARPHQTSHLPRRPHRNPTPRPPDGRAPG